LGEAAKNRVAPEIEKAVVELAIEEPAFSTN
jgi:hypothetical protein